MASPISHSYATSRTCETESTNFVWTMNLRLESWKAEPYADS